MEIGKLHLIMQTDQHGQTFVPDITLKNNFRQMSREEKIRILRMAIADLNDLKNHLDELPSEAAYDQFFSSMPLDHQKWRKQRGLC